MSRRPPVTETRLHPVGCACDDGGCIARAIRLDVSAVFDAPGPVRCDDAGDALELLRGPDDAAVAAARRGR